MRRSKVAVATVRFFSPPKPRTGTDPKGLKLVQWVLAQRSQLPSGWSESHRLDAILYQRDPSHITANGDYLLVVKYSRPVLKAGIAESFCDFSPLKGGSLDLL